MRLLKLLALVIVVIVILVSFMIFKHHLKEQHIEEQRSYYASKIPHMSSSELVTIVEKGVVSEEIEYRSQIHLNILAINIATTEIENRIKNNQDIKYFCDIRQREIQVWTGYPALMKLNTLLDFCLKDKCN
jgi:uncharacterized membrane protein YeiB